MVVSREESQAKFAKMREATLAHLPGQAYTFADRCEERAALHPDRVFIVFEDQRVTYGAFNERANAVADVARRAGLQCGDVAALLMTNRPEYVVTFAGLAKLGVTTALVNPNVRGEALRRALETSSARVLFVGAEALEHLATLGDDVAERWKVFVDSEEGSPVSMPSDAVDLGTALEGASRANPDPDLRAGLTAGDDLFYIYTSGTTGLPKAARLSHMRYLGVGDGMSAVSGFGPDDVLLCVLPLYHGAGVMVVVSSALAQGAKFVLCRKFSASRFWTIVREQGVTGCQYIGEICRYLLNQPPAESDREHSLRVMMGAGLGPDIWEEFQTRFGIERIHEGWSSTEANTSVLNLDNHIGSCGRIPFKEQHNGRLIRYDVETDSHPRDANGACIECEVGEAGEFIGMILDLPDSGAGRFEGYTSKSATEAKVLHDVFQSGDSWYRSGDLLRRDEDDYYYFVDRIGDTYRWKSENVSTQEVAEALGSFPGLQVANVYGVRIPGTGGRAGMAALVFADREAFDGAEFFSYIAERLPHYAVPFFVRLAGEADMTTTFKLRKMDLQRDGYDPERIDDPLFVRDEASATYVPLDPESLARAGFPPFVADPAET